MQAGLMCYPAQGTIDGRQGDHILLAPPYIISDDEMDMLVARLQSAVDLALASVFRAAAMRLKDQSPPA
jgi:adenosylmethionine-8-amino-7-oxononanoate aminotransferase